MNAEARDQGDFRPNSTLRASLTGARKVRVCIPTTEGVAEVLSLIRENAALAGSVIRVGYRLHEPFGLDNAYNEFVNSPSGLVERHFKHNRFRVDLSRPIETGSSWQLGLFLAHALAYAGRLATSRKDGGGDDADAIVWATGELRIDQRVMPVREIPKKLQLSEEPFRLWAKMPMLLCMPACAEGEGDVLRLVSILAQSGNRGAIFASEVNELLDVLGLPRIAPYAATGGAEGPAHVGVPTFRTPPPGSLAPVTFVLAGGAIALSLVLLAWTILR